MSDQRDVRHQNIREIRTTVNGYVFSRGVRNNWLIGKGVIIKPDFAVDVLSQVGKAVATIRGDEGEMTILCTQVVASKYRPDITFFDHRDDQSPVRTCLTPLQKARRNLLGVMPPNTSMPSAEFYEVTKKESGHTQVNARRRWGELRTEYGFDTTYNHTTDSFRRGPDVPVREPIPRPDSSSLMADHWRAVYERDGGTCNKCGRPIQRNEGGEGDPGLLDHRRPVPFGGDDRRVNLQLFCTRCNNIKNTVCQACPLSYECETCTWAYPEKFHDDIVIRLDPDDARTLENLAEKRDKDPRQLARDLFRAAFHNLERGERDS